MEFSNSAADTFSNEYPCTISASISSAVQHASNFAVNVTGKDWLNISIPDNSNIANSKSMTDLLPATGNVLIRKFDDSDTFFQLESLASGAFKFLSSTNLDFFAASFDQSTSSMPDNSELTLAADARMRFPSADGASVSSSSEGFCGALDDKCFPVSCLSSSTQINALDSNSRSSLNSSYSGGLVNEVVMDSHIFLPSSATTRKNQDDCKTMSVDGAKSGLVECPFCKRSCSKPSDLRVHLRAHTGQKPFQCVVCGRAFSQNCNVRKHLDSHKVWPHAASLPVCDHEEPNSTIEQSTSSHNSQVSDVRVVSDLGFSCPYCPEKFYSFLELRSHMPNHSDKKLYQCSLRSCRQLFRELQELLSHLKLHEGLLIYRCPSCNKCYNNLHDVGVHQFSHSLEPIAEETSNSKQQQKCPVRVKRPFRCFDCGDRFASAEALDRHKAQSTHSHKCGQCALSFKTARLLRAHLKQHLNVSSALYRCTKCDKVFKSSNAFNVHSRTHLPAMHQCTSCAKSFHRSFLLKRHIESVHSTIAKFTCQQCSKAFRRPDRYKSHLMTHAKAKTPK